MRFARHQLVYLDEAAWPAIVSEQPDIEDNPVVADWATLKRPLIARRPTCGDAAGRVPLGLPLPPSMGKRRLAFTAAPEAVLATCPPPRLADAVAVAPAAWRAAIAALVATDLDVRCFGSMAWEHLTGMPYLSATSDLDLLWQASKAMNANHLVKAIGRIEAEAPMRIDGEIVTPDGLAIQWREWGSGAPEVLVKSPHGSRLMARQAVFA